ncbi:putative glycosidase [Klebsiella pneumoniae]|nr:putative glycosidase [Klebsiella pneumoniae]
MQREEWFHRAVIYQVDSSLFYDANGDGFGDLAGIRQKLHYIRSLGATVLWLTPFYLTPLQDDGYDISDHLQPDPRFGTIADVIELIARAAHLRAAPVVPGGATRSPVAVAAVLSVGRSAAGKRRSSHVSRR